MFGKQENVGVFIKPQKSPALLHSAPQSVVFNSCGVVMVFNITIFFNLNVSNQLDNANDSTRSILEITLVLQIYVEVYYYYYCCFYIFMKHLLVYYFYKFSIFTFTMLLCYLKYTFLTFI